MSKLIVWLIAVMMLLQHMTVSAQSGGEENHEDHAFKGHRITLVMANSLLNNSFTEESSDILIVPTFGINYDYFLNERWGLGLHADILVQQFKVEKHGDKREIVRENPVGIAGMVLFRPHHRWVLMAGYGYELEKNENFQMVRIGAEYGIPMPNNWELGLSVEFDYKINTYSSMMFGVGFSKMLSGKKSQRE